MNKTTRILVVDDEPEILRVFTLILDSAGYEVWKASTGRQGLELAREKHPDLVLLDVLLPDLNGNEVCKQIKADPALRDIFVVLISGGAMNTTHKVEGLEAGADDYLVKPIDPDELLARIRTSVRLRDGMTALRASEEHHRRLIEILPDAVCLIRPDGRLLSVNAQAVAMLGYASAEELLKQSAFDITPVAEHERIRADIAAALETGMVRNAGYTLLKKNGVPVQVELSATVSLGGDGQPGGLLIVGRDVTERREAEQKIQQLLDLLDAAADTIVIRDLEGRIQYFNKGAERLLGWTAEEVRGRRTADLFFEDPSTFAKAQEKLLQTGEWEGELRVLTKARKPIIQHSRWTLVRGPYDQSPHVVSINTDITKHKQAEELVRASQERFRQLAENIREVFWITNPAKSEMIYISPGYEEIWGRTCESLYAAPTTWLEAVHPDDRARIQEAVLAKQISGQYDEVYRIVRPDGSIRWIHDRAFPVRDDSGEVYRIVGIAEDITQSKKTEKALRDTEANYRSIFENATEGIFRTTLEGRLLAANPALARMFGYQSPQEMLANVTDVGRQIYVSLEKRTEMKNLLLEQGVIQGFEEENYRKDGSIIWVSLNAHAVRDANGAIECFEGTIQDITNRKWAGTLLQTQRDFGTFLSSTIDLNATLLLLLEIALKNEGIDCGAVFLVDSGTGALDLVAHRGFSADFAERASHFAAVRPGGPLSRRWARLLDGIVRELKRQRLQAKEILPIQHAGEVVAVLAVGSRGQKEIPVRSRQAIEMITAQAAGTIARIRTEESLRASRRLLERTLESIPLAVFAANANTMTIEECNPATTEMFGYGRNELIGRSATTLHVNEAMAEEFARHLRAAIEGDGFLSGFEFKLRRKNGTVFPTEQSVMPIRNEMGLIVSHVNVVQDITERKRAEEELRRLPRRIIEAQEAERQRVAREIHDGVNQVIASVKMRLRKMESQMETLSPAAREILGRCDKLLIQALEENRRIAYNLRPSDLDELGLADACRNFCREVQVRTNLTVICNIAPRRRRLPPEVELNLFRIVQEALTNVERHARAKSVRLRLSFDGDEVVLKIQDDGRGIVPQRSKSGLVKWRGMGLANMRERALSLGGVCEVHSSPKNGTTISVRLPCKPAK
jgi:PAS domain S-box-containing protein